MVPVGLVRKEGRPEGRKAGRKEGQRDGRKEGRPEGWKEGQATKRHFDQQGRKGKGRKEGGKE